MSFSSRISFFTARISQKLSEKESKAQLVARDSLMQNKFKVCSHQDRHGFCRKASTMPIAYTVHNDGRFIYAIASGTVTDKDIIDYELTHNNDERIKAPANELFEIRPGSFKEVTKDAFLKILELRKASKELMPHRCAIVVSYGNHLAWDLARFYEMMATEHSRRSVIVFGDAGIARKWLGVEKIESETVSRTDKS